MQTRAFQLGRLFFLSVGPAVPGPGGHPGIRADGVHGAARADITTSLGMSKDQGSKHPWSLLLLWLQMLAVVLERDRNNTKDTIKRHIMLMCFISDT